MKEPHVLLSISNATYSAIKPLMTPFSDYQHFYDRQRKKEHNNNIKHLILHFLCSFNGFRYPLSFFPMRVKSLTKWQNCRKKRDDESSLPWLTKRNNNFNNKLNKSLLVFFFFFCNIIFQCPQSLINRLSSVWLLYACLLWCCCLVNSVLHSTTKKTNEKVDGTVEELDCHLFVCFVHKRSLITERGWLIWLTRERTGHLRYLRLESVE